MRTIKITTSQNIDIDYQLADIGDRILARLLDYVVFAGLSIVVLIIFGIFSGLINYYSGDGSNIGTYIMIGLWLLLCVMYDLICEIFFNGQSVGKRTMKIKVISLNGARPRVGQYLLRWVFRIIDFGVTGGSLAVITVALSDKRQRVGDMVADTAVVNLTPKNSFGQLVFGPPPADYQPVYSQVAQLTDNDVVVIHDVIKNFNRTRNSLLVYKLAMKLKSFLNVSYPREINEYQFLEIVLNDYNTITAKSEL
jgi:uncharacterized RDD family membrane protein YckC